jgi:signal transduction histidine kinase/ActR/RegA family two-component response regulator
VANLKLAAMSAPARLVDWLVPERLRSGDADTLRRARLVVALTLAIMVWAPIFGVIYHVLGLPTFSIGVAVAGALGALILGVMRETGSIKWSANLIALVLFSILAYLSFCSGGISSPAVPWLVAVPMVSTMMVGHRNGTVWLAMTLAMLVVLFIEDGSRWSLVGHLDAHQFAIWGFSAAAGITIVVYSLTLIYERLKDNALKTVLAANRAKSEFLTNMSHELRTPLTAILGFAELLQDDDQVTSAECNDRLETIRRNGQYLMELINDILDLSKIEAGKFEIERLNVSPARIVNDVVALLQVRADAKQLTLSAVFEGPFPATIHTDPTRLRQILINLVGNAIKFTESGTVTVTSRLLAADVENPRLSVRVADTGIGMTGEHMGKLFEPFSQADASSSRNYGGTGLGLAISRRLARLLDGEITVSSARGQGSVFCLEIAAGHPAALTDVESLAGLTCPLTSAVPPPASQGQGAPRAAEPADRHESQLESILKSADVPPDPSPKPLAGLKVLIAEDGPDNRELVGFVLKKGGAEVAFAENGRIAVDIARAAEQQGRPFDLILMDMQMPVLDGYAATRELRAAGYQLPIIALTAHAMSDDRDKCLEAGCDDYTTKPINRNELVALVARHAAASLQPA